MSRPRVNVFNVDGAAHTSVNLPSVFSAPIRSDVVQYVHTLMSKNSRQPYSVSYEAGHQTPAISWGTGRAVSRIPRVPGGGTSRSGQGAFGNMCRGGRMFSPTKIWRKWHKKISVNQRRFAVSSALAATAVVPLVFARGHRIEEVPELPLVVNDSINKITKTKDALNVLEKLGANPDVEKSGESRKIRAGAGKARNRRYVQRKGPLVIYSESEGLHRAFRNIPGVDIANVDNLSLLDLAPGGHLGRFVIWTAGAFERLDSIFGTYDTAAKEKSGFNLPRSQMSNTDLARLINSDEVQSIVNPAETTSTVLPIKRNPTRTPAAKVALNPYHKAVQAREQGAKKITKAQLKAKRATSKKFASGRKSFYNAARVEGSVEF